MGKPVSDSSGSGKPSSAPEKKKSSKIGYQLLISIFVIIAATLYIVHLNPNSNIYEQVIFIYVFFASFPFFFLNLFSLHHQIYF